MTFFLQFDWIKKLFCRFKRGQSSKGGLRPGQFANAFLHLQSTSLMVTMFMFFRGAASISAPVAGDGSFQPPLSDSSSRRPHRRN
jgi:hypothetical protein